eukprot:6212356-Pleurochrysis_carterae.AAC.1
MEELRTDPPQHSHAHHSDSVHCRDRAHDGDARGRGGPRFLLTHPPSPERGCISRLAGRGRSGRRWATGT